MRYPSSRNIHTGKKRDLPGKAVSLVAHTPADAGGRIGPEGAKAAM
jgi:hypothetical protein